MAPRGRPPKLRTSLMDAAIDAVKPLGFTKEVVTDKIRQLLKEYEGEYMFIEADAYSVLLESLISDQDAALPPPPLLPFVPPPPPPLPLLPPVPPPPLPPPPPPSPPPLPPPPPPPPSSPPPPPPPSSPPPPPTPSSPPPPPPPPPSPPLPILDVVLLPPPHVLHATLPPPENVQPRRRKPCHGWICDDDEELQFIILPSSFNRQISPTPKPH